MAGNSPGPQPLQCKLTALSDLKADPSNVRRHDERNLEAIKASLERFGQQKPVVVDENGVVVAGNGTIEAARALGWKKLATVRSELKGADRIAYSIADNRTAELASWSDDLAGALESLRTDGVDLESMGFTGKELDQLVAEMSGKQEIVEDEVPEPPVDPITKPGDLWLCGDHRLLCGDSTKGEDVARALEGSVPFIMVTDPPYGVEYDPEWRHRAGINDSSRTGDVTNDGVVDWSPAFKRFPGGVAYVWHSGLWGAGAFRAICDGGFAVRAELIWRKQQFVVGRGHYNWQHEGCYYAVRNGDTSRWAGDGKQSTVWDIDNPLQSGEEATVHGTQKPVECMARPIRNHGGKNDDVYDPFLGSGTTMIACEQLGRKCVGIEIECKYVDVCCERWAKLTGRQPTLDETGKTFKEMGTARNVKA